MNRRWRRPRCARSGMPQPSLPFRCRGTPWASVLRCNVDAVPTMPIAREETVTVSQPEIVAEVRRRLAEVADSQKAPQMQAYMKSSMPFLGVSAVPMRKTCKAVFDDLLIDWVALEPNSPGADKSIAELEIRRTTGVTIIAIIAGSAWILERNVRGVEVVK